MRLWLPLIGVFALALAALADDASDFRDRRDKLAKEEYARRLALAKYAESIKLWKEAAAEYARLAVIAPDDPEISKLAEKAKERADITTSRPTKAEEQQYFQGLGQLGHDFAKKYWDLAAFAKSKVMWLDAEDAADVASAMDAAAGAPDKAAPFFADLFPKDDERRKAVEALNVYRKSCALPPVYLSPHLSDGAQKHALYLVKNQGHPSTEGLGAHNEDPALPLFTPEGKHAGTSSDIGFQTPLPSMVAMIGTYYHRIPLLDPALRKVGYGYAPYEAGKENGPCVIDCMTGVDRGGKRPDADKLVIAYPAPGQKNVQRGFDNELPDPIPQGEDKDCGTCVTLTWFAKAQLGGDLTLELRNGKDVVEGYLSTPARPARSDRGNGPTICFIPKDFLPADTTFTVTVTGTVDDKPFKKSWEFTTGKLQSDSMGR